MSETESDRQHDTVQQHDSKWCPGCETRGIIDEFRTRIDETDEWRRVRSRIFACPSCEQRWQSYA